MDNSPDKQLEQLKSAIKKANQEVFWNVSEDIYEDVAFHIYDDQSIIFHGINSGYKLTDITNIGVHRGSIDNDDSNISLRMDNGDILSFGSLDWKNSMTLENREKNLFLVNQPEIEKYFQDTFNQSIVFYNISSNYDEDDYERCIKISTQRMTIEFFEDP